MQDELSRKIQKVHNFESLVDYLRDTLHWPIPDNGLEFDDITFDWSPKDLELDADTQAQVVGCWQLQPLNLEFDLSKAGDKPDADDLTHQQKLVELGIQPWGIFFIQFKNDVKLDACKTLLRDVLKGLADNPKKKASLPFWRHDKLLFICITANFQNIGFTCFRDKKGHLPIVNDYIPLIHFKLNV